MEAAVKMRVKSHKYCFLYVLSAGHPRSKTIKTSNFSEKSVFKLAGKMLNLQDKTNTSVDIKKTYETPAAEWLTVESRNYFLASHDSVSDDEDPFNK